MRGSPIRILFSGSCGSHWSKTVKLVKRLLYNRDTVKTEILLTPIKDLGLQVRRSILETCIDRALEDLRAFGIEIEPSFYLSDGYGCLEGATTIALGFWDADPIIREILRETKDIFRDEKEILRLIKHEDIRVMYQCLGDFQTLADCWRSRPNQVGWDYNCNIATPADTTIDTADLLVIVRHWLTRMP